MNNNVQTNNTQAALSGKLANTFRYAGTFKDMHDLETSNAVVGDFLLATEDCFLSNDNLLDIYKQCKGELSPDVKKGDYVIRTLRGWEVLGPVHN